MTNLAYSKRTLPPAMPIAGAIVRIPLAGFAAEFGDRGGAAFCRRGGAMGFLMEQMVGKANDGSTAQGSE